LRTAIGPKNNKYFKSCNCPGSVIPTKSQAVTSSQ
jgi:hypothetical protein